jgi:riboflavin biosynthesis pyrimidine reductase
MLTISAQQLAELLIGIARAQTAVIHGVDNVMAGTKTQHIVPALQNAAHLRDHPNPTLIDLPVRILLTSQGRVPPDPAVVVRELERLLGSTTEPTAAGALDFSAPR